MSLLPRIKMCGFTREADAEAAALLGVDAIGLVFYPKSPRVVTLDNARRIAEAMPPFVDVVALFVNPLEDEVRRVLDHLPVHMLQFHGDEAASDCERYRRPYLKAARMKAGLDLVEYAARHPLARGLLLDAWVEGYGGGGETFDWSWIPDGLTRPIILSGGLTPENIGEAVRQVRPAAVDVSSGIEVDKGIKDPARMAAFIAGVRDAQL